MADGAEDRRVVEVVLPQLGESVAEGTVTEWLKTAGQAVEADEPLCEISTDKVNTDLPSPVEGKLLEVLVDEGQTVEVGTVLARIASPRPAGGEARPAAGADAGPGEAEGGGRLHFEDSSISLWGDPGGTPAEGGGAREEGAEGMEAEGGADAGAAGRAAERAASPPPRHSPAVRTLARREEVDLASVEGTGRDGRVTREDVLRHVEERKAGPEGPERVRTESAGPDDRRELLSPVRRVIADRLAESKDTIPHSTTVMEADLSTVAALRERERDAFEDREGVSLTYLPFVAHAAVRALEEHPKMNAVLEGEEIRYRSAVNLGVAVATEEGLVVPVVHGAESLAFAELARRMRDAAAEARTGRLRPEDVQGGTFTLTNHGRGGSLWGTPIIVPGQTGILGVGKIRSVPVAVGGEVEVREACYLSLSFDHRTVDGAEADAFLRSIVDRLSSFGVARLGEKR